jgi:hypothetical protein
MYDTEFSRRLRSSVPPSPGSPSRGLNSNDVFGDITPLKGSPRMGSPSARKGKGVPRDYGDRYVSSCSMRYQDLAEWMADVGFRFIPTREPTINLQAAYQLMPEFDQVTGREITPKSKGRRKSGPGTDQDVRRGENRTTRLVEGCAKLT